MTAQPGEGDRTDRAQEIGQRDCGNDQKIGLEQATAAHGGRLVPTR